MEAASVVAVLLIAAEPASLTQNSTKELLSIPKSAAPLPPPVTSLQVAAHESSFVGIVDF
jgi:hypothetical protein